MPARLGHLRGWIFDLDNTLYSPYSSLFPQIHARMQDYIVESFGVTPEKASELRTGYFRRYGTTLRGLMEEHKTNPDHFLDYVHDIDLSELQPSPRLTAALKKLPGKKLVFTNADRRHAGRILSRLGLSEIFEAVFDIADGGYVCKPEPAPYAALCRAQNLAPQECAMFEDMQVNLVSAAEMGMRTVWLRHEADWLRTKPEAPSCYPHCHYAIDDLIPFLEKIMETP